MKRKRIKISEKVLVYVSNVNNFVHKSDKQIVNQNETSNKFDSELKTNRYEIGNPQIR